MGSAEILLQEVLKFFILLVIFLEQSVLVMSHREADSHTDKQN